MQTYLAFLLIVANEKFFLKVVMVSQTAYLSNDGTYTIFSFGDSRLKFVVPYSLERYESVVKWDDGYLVVMAKYTHNKDAEEG